ncbi:MULTISPECIES: hypothetical protein [Psychrilyobacter]|uniref:hypothetical protein n=1 Tax=Psychrilyobacter TaxID=623282 RepID=UPI0013149BA9|nr:MULTISPECIES: hypothetical protein [Psychrilyobacter]MCS5421230.1 hypothetical protein [Psychrilyobacter sp. S5]NDI77013.1 hypothetical protein [Psychrilyobacter piezotolerans]
MRKLSELKPLKVCCPDIIKEAKEKYILTIGLWKMSREELNKFVKDHKLKVSELRDN